MSSVISNIDETKPMIISAYKHEAETNREDIEMAIKCNMPEMLICKVPIPGASITIAEKEVISLLNWISTFSDWLDRLECELRCIGEDSEGDWYFVTWISLAELERYSKDSSDTLQNALMEWKGKGGMDVCINMHLKQNYPHITDFDIALSLLLQHPENMIVMENDFRCWIRRGIRLDDGILRAEGHLIAEISEEILRLMLPKMEQDWCSQGRQPFTK